MGKLRELFARLFHGWARKVSRARSIKSRVAWVAAGIVPVLCACCFAVVAISPSESPAERAAPTESEGGAMSVALSGDVEPAALVATLENEIADLPAPTQEPRATIRPTRTATARPEPTDTIEATATEAAAPTVTATSTAEAPVVVVEPTTPPPTPAPEPTTPPTEVPAPPPTEVPASPPTEVPAPPPTEVPAPPPTEVPAPPPPTEVPAPPAPSSGRVVIDWIYYDGQVSRVESDEYAVITNVGGSPVNLAGWSLWAGDPGQTFYFPAYELAPGASCRVYTNIYDPATCGFSFGKGQAIWNNRGDCGVLYDANGGVADEYCY